MVLGFNFEKKQLKKQFEEILKATGMDEKKYNHYLTVFEARYKEDRKIFEDGYGESASTTQVLRRIKRDVEDFTKEAFSQDEERNEKRVKTLLQYLARLTAGVLHLTEYYIPKRQASFEESKGHRKDALNICHEAASQIQNLGIDTSPIGEIIHNKLERNGMDSHAKKLVRSIGSFFKK